MGILLLRGRGEHREMSDESGERREGHRVPLLLRIDWAGTPGDPADPAIRDATENLSAGGLFIRTDRNLPPGTQLPLLISFPGLLEPLEVEVEVAWVRRAERGLPTGVAVKIPPGRAEDREKLLRLVRAADRSEPADRTYQLLLVEDNVLVMSMYEAALKKLRSPEGRVDVHVDFARDGVEALARLQRKPRVELVIADLYMPVMDGFTLVEKIRSVPEMMGIPILAISAGGEPARVRAVELGVDVYLQKPVRIGEILGTVRALLHIR